MRFGSVCSGIEAASVAFAPLGWKAAWLAEIEPFPCAVLAHHYPDVPNLGDMTTLPARVQSGEVEAPELLCGGTPCQAFSVAGLRASLADARGNLSLTFCEVADAIDARRLVAGLPACIVLWENVPGVLSTKDNAFGCFLAGLAGEDGPLQSPGGKWPNAGVVLGPQRAVAWRVLDAQYFGVAQRRRRVFVIASARNGFDPAKVLLEFDGVRRDTAPSREAGESATHATAPCLTSSGRGVERIGDTRGQDPVVAVAFGGNNQSGPIDVATARNACASASGRMDFESETFLCQQTTHTLRGEGFDASEDGTGRGTPLVPVQVCPTLRAGGNRAGGDRPPGTDVDTADSLIPIVFDATQITSATNRSNPKPGDPCHPLAAGAHAPAIAFPANLSGTQCASTENLSPSLGALNPTAVAVRTANTSANGHGLSAELSHTLDRANGQAVAYALQHAQIGRKDSAGPQGKGWQEEVAFTQDSRSCADAVAVAVRWLTPTECERLQGFSDGYTAIPWRKKPASECPDGPRYKALGNSWAVPVARWIGARIQKHLGGAL